MEIPFFKYHGTGNDFVLFDNRDQKLRGDEHAFFQAICHRRFGIGADGVILLNAHDSFDFEMDYFNSDGGRSSMCGNGGRCMVQFAHDLGIVRDSARFTAVDGPHVATLQADTVTLEMAPPQPLQQLQNGDFWIHTGSPHYVRLLDGPLDEVDVVGIGRSIRNSTPYAPGGTNVNFVHVTGAGEAHVRTYERGVEDETWSCGTGVTAVALVLHATQPGCPDAVTLHTPGGKLVVHVRPGAAPWLQGPARFVFQGTINLPANA